MPTTTYYEVQFMDNEGAWGKGECPRHSTLESAEECAKALSEANYPFVFGVRVVTWQPTFTYIKAG